MTAAKEALGHWGLRGATTEPLGTGLINETLLITTAQGDRYVLQGLNAVFAPEVNIDIDDLTRHLASRGQRTLRLIPTLAGNLWCEAGGRAWRLSTFVPGVCRTMLESAEQAAAAGRLLASFHINTGDLQMSLHTERLGVHDTKRHLANLERALVEHRDHRNFDVIEPLAHAVLAEAERLPALPELPDRLVHGDPKISNLVFDERTGDGVCMIDLDTLTHMPLPLEMGDAFRSWCNPRGEDTQRSNFRIDYFAAAVAGYADVARHEVSEHEWQAFVPATRTIMVELAARFTRDALLESYFGWNPAVFPDRSTHNQVRAHGQLELEKSLAAQADEAIDLVAAAFQSAR